VGRTAFARIRGQDWRTFTGGLCGRGAGVAYVFYDISVRPIYIGDAGTIRDCVRNHQDKFWFKRPIVNHGAYIEIADERLRTQVERIPHQIPEVERRAEQAARGPLRWRPRQEVGVVQEILDLSARRAGASAPRRRDAGTVHEEEGAERFHGNRRRLLSGNPDDFPAKRQHRKSPVSRAFSVAGL
jgi:hypothetical protein